MDGCTGGGGGVLRTHWERRAELNSDLPGCESPMRKTRASVRFQPVSWTFVGEGSNESKAASEKLLQHM